MNLKIQRHHQERYAYIYLRQSTTRQLKYNQESTERQYALKDKALSLGWTPHLIKILDGDLGMSGTQINMREDFKTLIADVSLNKVGCVFAIEASRLSRSCKDWHRLLELCSLTSTLIIDEDGCYDPCDFNDQLILGVKGTLSQAELHFIRARLLGGKRNKAGKGELRFPLPIGLAYDREEKIVPDSDEQVRGAVLLLFKVFRECGSAFGVVRYFADHNIQFPKRVYGGIWDGKLVWDRLRISRVLDILKNPSYAGTYVFGRYKASKSLSAEGKITVGRKVLPMSLWEVLIPQHHEGYISWQGYHENQKILENNRSDRKEAPVAGAAREGSALLQGLLICGECGRRLIVKYSKRREGVCPSYSCSARQSEFSGKHCIWVRGIPLDEAISQRVLEIMEPAQLKIALKAWEELEAREASLNEQWVMQIERAKYEAQLAQRCYEEVDPSNRLVAATLEKRWNDALEKIEILSKEYEDSQQKSIFNLTKNQKQQILSLAKDLPSLWRAPTTLSKDRKRILRLLIKDIIIKRKKGEREVALHIGWQGGKIEDLEVAIPLPVYERWRTPEKVIDMVRALSIEGNSDAQIARFLNEQGFRNRKNNLFDKMSVQWIRFKYSISLSSLKQHDEFTVKEVREKFGVSEDVVYYWVKHSFVRKRQREKGAPLWIAIDTETEAKLKEKVRNSKRIQQFIARGAL